MILLRIPGSAAMLSMIWLISALVCFEPIVAQNVRNNGTITNNGTTSINGYFQNYKNATGGIFNNTGGTYTVGSYFSNFNSGGTDGQANISAGTLAVTGNFTNDEGITTINGTGTLQISGAASTNTAGTFTHTAGTVNYSGAAQNIFTATYFDLTLSGSGTKTMTGAITVSNSLNVNGSISMADAGFQITGGSGTLTLGAAATLTLGSAGTGTSMPTFTSNSLNATSTVDFASAQSQSIKGINYGNLTSSSTGARTLENGTTIGVAGTFTPGSNSYTNTGSTVNFNGAGTQTIPAFSSFNNLTISGDRGSATVTLASGTISVAGTMSYTATNLTLSTTGNTFEYSGTGAQSVVNIPYYILSLTNTGAKTLNTTISVSNNMNIGSTADVTVGTSGILTVSGTLTNDGILTNDGTITLP